MEVEVGKRKKIDHNLKSRYRETTGESGDPQKFSNYSNFGC